VIRDDRRAMREVVRRSLPRETLATLEAQLGAAPIDGAVVLGSGLGSLLDGWRPRYCAAGGELPGYPRSSVPGHAGRVALVDWGGRAGLVLQGRVHFYEGFERAEVTFGVRLAAALGARWLLLTNAAGSADPRAVPGTVVTVDDHIRLFIGGRAARGAIGGPPVRGSPYDAARTEQAFALLSATGLRTMRGILGGWLGPSYETAAEVETLRRAGATVACMSTVIEAEEAARLGLEVVAVSLVTNFATGLSDERLTHADVVATAARVGPQLARGIDRLVRAWAAEPGPGAVPG
jgi:purine-nucleoside phosphorylase